MPQLSAAASGGEARGDNSPEALAAFEEFERAVLPALAHDIATDVRTRAARGSAGGQTAKPMSRAGRPAQDGSGPPAKKARTQVLIYISTGILTHNSVLTSPSTRVPYYRTHHEYASTVPS